MFELALGNEGRSCPPAKDQYVEPAGVIGDYQRVGSERASFEPRTDTGDQAGMAQEPRRPSGPAQQPFRQQVRRHIEEEKSDKARQAQAVKEL